MNHYTHIFTRSRKYLDQRVWLTMALVSLISLGLLGYKVASDIQCTPFEIALKGYTAGMANSYYVGEEIVFSTQMKGGTSIVWDFGDHSSGKGTNVTHRYSTEGNYIITATVNGKCLESVSITITSLHQPINLTTTLPNPITGPDAVHALEPINLTASGAGTSYEWMVLNSPDFPVQTKEIATYTFLSPGTRIIELKVDNDPKKVFRKTLQVLPAIETGNNQPLVNENLTAPVIVPPPSLQKEEPNKEAEPEKPKTTIIPNEEFVAMFNQVTEGKKDLSSFNQYLCNGGQTKILANGTDWETLISFYQKINDKKKYDIKSVEAVRDPESNCVTVLKVKYKKRTLGVF